MDNPLAVSLKPRLKREARGREFTRPLVHQSQYFKVGLLMAVLNSEALFYKAQQNKCFAQGKRGVKKKDSFLRSSTYDSRKVPSRIRTPARSICRNISICCCGVRLRPVLPAPRAPHNQARSEVCPLFGKAVLHSWFCLRLRSR